MEMNIGEYVNRVLERAQAEGISPAEVSLAQEASFSAAAREGKLERYEVSDSLRIVLRGKCGERIGTASTQALDEESIDLLIRGVRESAELIETEEQDEIMPPDEKYESVVNFSESLENVSAQEKIALAMDIDRRMNSVDKRLKVDDSCVATSRATLTLRNTLGLDLTHTSNEIYAYTSALAQEGEHSATGFKILWGYGLKDVPAEQLVRDCAEEALSNLHAGRMKSGVVPVVIKHSAMADLLRTFCGIFSADNAQQGLSLLAGREGEKIASEHVTLVDDPLMPWGPASCPFDREGAATYTKNVIEGGTLKTLLHNRKTAKKAGVRTTGNAAGGGQVSPSNLYIAPGDAPLEELFSAMGDGLYLTEVTGLHAGANVVSGDFSLLSRGFEVKEGKIARAVEQFTVAGNFYALLGDIQQVANDLTFIASPIGCPSVRVGSLSVAGE